MGRDGVSRSCRRSLPVRVGRRAVVVVAVTALVSLAFAVAASAAILHVTSSADDGSAGTLRSVIAAAGDGDTVVIDPGVQPHLSASSGGIVISPTAPLSLTIQGQGARSTTITGDGADSTFDLFDECECGPTPVVTISGVTLSGGGSSGGGAIFVGGDTTATLTADTLSGNTVTNGDGSGLGGAVYDAGVLTLDGVTASGNSASTDGGAVYVTGTAEITNSTITGNTAGGLGGGVSNQGQTTLVGDTLAGNQASAGDGGNIGTNTVDSGTMTTLTDSIVTGGIAKREGPNCFGVTMSGGHNLESTGPQSECGLSAGLNDLIDVNPLLDPLGDYGGPTDTMALAPGSPAIGHGSCGQTALNGVDQRGLPRPGAGETACDTGAYEFQLDPTSVAVTCTPNPAGFGAPTTCSATVTDQVGAGVGPPSGTVTFSGTAGSFGATGTCMLSGAGASASCAVPLTPNALGSEQVTAAYAGDAAHAASSGATPLSVTPGPPVSFSVLCAPGTVAPGASTTCTATVGAVAGGSSARPTGSVAFTVHGATTVKGGGTCTLHPSGAPATCAVTYTLGSDGTGTYDVTAAYGGDATHLPASVPTSFAATPTAGKAANVSVVSGTVRIELPSAHSFSPLFAGRTSPVPGVVSPVKGATVAVPMGSTVDTTKGRLALATAGSYAKPAAAAPPTLQNATLTASIFTIEQMTAKQARAHLKRGQHRLFGIPPTTLGMRTPRRATAKARCHRSAAPGKGVVRAISGTGKGLFRTVGANSITTITNATWIVSDRCDGTLTEVGRGRATVTPIHPTHKHERPVVITAGQGVLIKGRFV
jgi:predicted outer membrane repeat protein